MKKNIEWTLAIIALVVLGTAIVLFLKTDMEEGIKILTVTAAILFFTYKLLTGWLFINLQVEIKPLRQKIDDNFDHLSLELGLTKGDIDSLWLTDLEFRISYGSQIKFVQPTGFKKSTPIIDPQTGKPDYWNGPQNKYYVLSPNDKTAFSCYVQVNRTDTIIVEALVTGTRPFYSLEKKSSKPIQWKSSIIVLPCKT